jgi:hypothetical protein
MPLFRNFILQGYFEVTFIRMCLTGSNIQAIVFKIVCKDERFKLLSFKIRLKGTAYKSLF